jgi:hypothetical protein
VRKAPEQSLPLKKKRKSPPKKNAAGNALASAKAEEVKKLPKVPPLRARLLEKALVTPG